MAQHDVQYLPGHLQSHEKVTSKQDTSRALAQARNKNLGIELVTYMKH